MILGLTVSFLILLFISVPVAITIGLAGTFALWLGDLPLFLAPQRIYVMLDSFVLMAIPFFVVAGTVMERGGISRRLFAFADALVGSMWGGLAQASTFTSLIFAGISGSASADTAATATVVCPLLKKQGYPAGWAAALEAAGGTLGPIMPPSILMIIYGSITGLSIRDLFLAGVFPAMIMTVGFMVVNYVYAKRFHIHEPKKFNLRELKRTFVESIWALLAPIVILGGIFSGVFTPTEAGAIAVWYAVLVSMFIYRELTVKQLWDVLLRSARTTAIVMIIIGASGIVSWIFAYEQVPLQMVQVVESITSNPHLIIVLFFVLLLFLGCFIEVGPLAIIMIPVLDPIAKNLQIEPIYFALIMLIGMVIGMATPPLGSQLFLASSIAQVPVHITIRYIWPYILIMIFTAALMIAVPPLTTFLPSL